MYTYKAEVLRVVDGDTVDLLIDLGFSIWKKERIRLYGVNAPETRTRDKKEKYRGLLSKERLIELIEEPKEDIYLITSEKGKYGRYLGELYIRNIEYLNKEKIIKILDLGVTKVPINKGIKTFDLNGVTYACVNNILILEGHAVEYFGGKRT